MAGRFITFEGGEGSGKTTQLERLAARLRASGCDPLVTREPGGTPVSEAIRAILLDAAESPTPLCEALLMEAARAHLVERAIRPALAAGRWVLCDRYGDSTLAYQGGGRGLDTALLEGLNRAATGGLEPDLTLLYDLDPEIGVARRHQGSAPTNRLDREPLDFHARVRSRYLDLAAREPLRWRVLDATLPLEELERQAWDALAAWLPPGSARAASMV